MDRMASLAETMSKLPVFLVAENGFGGRLPGLSKSKTMDECGFGRLLFSSSPDP
jgi:hypothetical protein